jgi:predicted GIY-YIG superfamily endonuclease
MEKKKRKKKSQGKTYLYKVEISGIIRYYGITNDLKRRQSQHNLGLHKREKKELYDFLVEQEIDKITLIEVQIFKKRIDAKRMEAFLILEDYFSKKELKQKVPSLSDR